MSTTYNLLILNKNTKYHVSLLFKAISDQTRIAILYALKKKDLNVTEIAETLNMSQSAISHQLRVLRNTNLVSYRKLGKENYYYLTDNHVYEILNQAIQHVEEDL